MRILLIIAFFMAFGTIIGAVPAFADNSLQDTNLHAESAVITLDISFGQDRYQQLLYKTLIHPQLDSINLEFYGDEVILHEPELKVTKSGDHFRITSLVDNIIIYGHKNSEINNYKINIYYGTNNGLIKFSAYTEIPLEDDKVIETTIPEIKNKYIPELIISSSHDYKTYWKQDFNLDVQAYDAKRNPTGTGFEGRLDNVDITAIISLGDKTLATIKGVTEYGEWKSNYYIKENLIKPGEYTVDIIASYLNQTISKSSSMFIVGSVVEGGSSKHSPVAIAGDNQIKTVDDDVIMLDGSASSDSDGDTITYSWSQTSGEPLQDLSDTTAIQPTFTPTGTGTFVFQLTVTDTTGRTGTDTVSITIS